MDNNTPHVTSLDVTLPPIYKTNATADQYAIQYAILQNSYQTHATEKTKPIPRA
jgi:hypothetical protein